ncbi:hypothetical protein [Eoetvoesiella caeni]
MNRQLSVLSRPTSMLFALCLGLASASVLAAGGSAQANSSARAQYQQDMALCKSGQSTTESRATCEREAGAALQAAERGQLTAESSSGYKQDATSRCMSLPEGQRQDCMTLMNNPQNARVQGSVGGGGVLRETTITVPGDATMSGSMPPAAPRAMPNSSMPNGSMSNGTMK